jgi:hypothetical protein
MEKLQSGDGQNDSKENLLTTIAGLTSELLTEKVTIEVEDVRMEYVRKLFVDNVFSTDIYGWAIYAPDIEPNTIQAQQEAHPDQYLLMCYDGFHDQSILRIVRNERIEFPHGIAFETTDIVLDTRGVAAMEVSLFDTVDNDTSNEFSAMFMYNESSNEIVSTKGLSRPYPKSSVITKNREIVATLYGEYLKKHCDERIYIIERARRYLLNILGLRPIHSGDML